MADGLLSPALGPKGKANSGSKSGPVVKNQKQAVAIALSQGAKASQGGGKGKK